MDSAVCVVYCMFFFKQKTAYELRISDWSSDVCSSDLRVVAERDDLAGALAATERERDKAEAERDQLKRAASVLAGERDTARAEVQEQGNEQIGRAPCRARVGQYE